MSNATGFAFAIKININAKDAKDAKVLHLLRFSSICFVGGIAGSIKSNIFPKCYRPLAHHPHLYENQ